MNLAIASGKGGTGKTTVAVNLAYVLAERGEKVRLLDCDVEEPNDHLFVQPNFTQKMPVEVLKPVWDQELCTACGICAEVCQYNAIAVVKGTVLIFNELCHSCGACSYVCPEKALTEKPIAIGVVDVAPENEPFYFAHGVLNIGEALAPAVVRRVKQHCHADCINIIDASPGTSCPVVESVASADVVLLVTEPTPFGLNDLKLAVGLALIREIPTCIVVNRSDGTDEIIAKYAEEINVPIVGRIPFKREYAEVYSRGEILVHAFQDWRDNLLDIYGAISDLVGTTPPPNPPETDFAISTEPRKPLPEGDADHYKEITVVSGKGGSGKTTVVASLALLIDNKVLADNDVDAADLHLLLEPSVREAHDFIGGQQAVIDPKVCTACGQCCEACHFDAIYEDGPLTAQGLTTCRIDEFGCEGCGLCKYVCKFGAISLTPNTVGKWYLSDTDYGPMAHARLGIAEENSGRLVTQVRHVAAELARSGKHSRILGDGPPGTGCPVIASLSGADLVMVVTEPTVSGVHDMVRVLQLTEHFGIPARIVINKADLNPDQAARIEQIAASSGAKVIAKIPFDRNVNDALMAGKTVIEHGAGKAYEALVRLGNDIKKEM